MKIVYIHRQPRPGAFSIENLFHTIAETLRQSGETIIEHEMGPRSRLLSDIRALRNFHADIYHVTGDVNYLVPLLPRHKTVLTVHDIGHYLFGLKGWRRKIYKWIWLALPIRLAKRVTAVSAATRDHIVEHLSFSREKITVVENCYHPMYRPVPKAFNSGCPRILQVGTKPYKNVPRLIQALKGLPCHLVLVGELDAEIQAVLETTQVSYENWVGLSQEALLQQYREADLVAFVSIGEGFGMPIIEAQAMGKPLITANIPPMSTVAGAGACLADPLDVGSIRAGICRLIEDSVYRQQVIAAGLLNVARYAPATIAEAYLRVYREVSYRASSPIKKRYD